MDIGNDNKINNNIGLFLKEPVELFFNNELYNQIKNLNNEFFQSIGEENYLPINSKFNDIDNNNIIFDQDDNLLIKLDKLMKEQNISYEGTNICIELFRTLLNTKKKELIQPMKNQVNFKLTKGLSTSSNPEIVNFKKNLKFLINCYENEGSNIISIIFSINKFNTELFEPLFIISKSLLFYEEEDEKNILKKSKKQIKKHQKSLISKLADNPLVNDTKIFINLFNELFDSVISLQNQINIDIKTFEEYSLKFDNIEDKQKTNDGINLIIGNLNKIINLIDCDQKQV